MKKNVTNNEGTEVTIKWYKKKRWIAVIVLVVFIAIPGGETEETEVTTDEVVETMIEDTADEVIEEIVETVIEEVEEEVEELTMGQKNALRQAESYLNYTNFSYTGLIAQLEYEEYSTEDATYAVDNCGADWKEQAVGKAKSYLEYSSFSKQGLIDQLEYEGFTTEQATYGVEQNGY